MADGQTDWLSVGARKTKAQRLLEVVTAREEERLKDLQHRRLRLRRLLGEEDDRNRQELQEKYCDLEQERLTRRLEAAKELQDLEEEARVKFVLRADEERRKQQCHHYREAYSRQIQRYLNESRPQEILLKTQMERAYGIPKRMPAVHEWLENKPNAS